MSPNWRDFLPQRAALPFQGQLKPSPIPERVTAIINPTSLHAARTRVELVRQADKFGLPSPHILFTEADDPGVGQAKQALADGAQLVLAAGGDGTVRLVAGVLAGSGVPLGVIPIGSANIFARNLGLSPKAVGAAITLGLRGRVGSCDVGRVSVCTDGIWSDTEPMLTMAGMGRDAASIEAVRPKLKRVFGWLAYAEAGARQAARSMLPMSVQIDGEPPREVAAWSVLAANCPQVPMQVVPFPEARLDNGSLEVLEVEVHSASQWLPIAAKGFVHFASEVEGLRYRSATLLEVNTSDPLPVQVDGDSVGEVSAMRVTIESAALKVRAAASNTSYEGEKE